MKSNERIKKVAWELANAYRGKITNLGGAVITTAYVLAKSQNNPSINMETIEDFLKSINDGQTEDIILRNLSGLWDTVQNFVGKYETEDLKSIVLYENSFFEMSTPESLISLASSILNIDDKDSILEICSGTATFPAYTLYDKKINSYVGIDINYNSNDIAILRASLLGNNYSFILNNALTYNFSSKYDKIFSNYPFAIKGADLDTCRSDLQDYFNLNNAAISRCTSDWLFNALIMKSLKENGKAVAIMTNGSAYNMLDLYMRQFFVENGFIEAVINLPSRLFADFSIPVTMLVLSYNNKSVKLINAEDIYTKKDRRQNILSNQDIEAILESIQNGGENVIDATPESMREHDYHLIASHYIEIPEIENGVCFEDVIKSITRGAQVKTELLESYKSISPTNFRCVSLSNISNGTIEIEDGEQYITELPKALERFVIPNNAIVLSKIASPTFRSAVVNVENGQSMIATNNLYIIEIDESKANPYYIQAFFDSVLGEATLNHSSGGMTVRTISTDAVKNLIIPLPPLEEQNRIAVKYQAAIDEYVILKRKIQKVLEKKRVLLESEE